MCQMLGLQTDLFIDNLLEFITDPVGSEARTKVIVDLGLCSENQVQKLGSPLNTISNHLSQMLSYKPKERDMLLMRNEVYQFD